MPGQRQRIQRHLQQRAVVGRIAHQDRAQQVLPVAGDYEFFIDDLIGIDIAHRIWRARVRVADRGDVHIHQLEPGAHIRAEELHVAFAH